MPTKSIFSALGAPTSLARMHESPVAEVWPCRNPSNVTDEGRDLGFEIARQVIVLEQDTVLERLMPALDLALGHRMIRRTTDVQAAAKNLRTVSGTLQKIAADYLREQGFLK